MVLHLDLYSDLCSTHIRKLSYVSTQLVTIASNRNALIHTCVDFIKTECPPGRYENAKKEATKAYETLANKTGQRSISSLPHNPLDYTAVTFIKIGYKA